MLALAIAALAVAAGTGSTSCAAQPAIIAIGYIGHPYVPPPNPYPLDDTAQNEGLDGAQLGIDDDNGTGRFTGQTFELDPTIVRPEADVDAAILSLKENTRFIVTNLPAAELLHAAKQFPNRVFINAGSTDDALRGAECLRNMLHTIPSRAMLTDGLAQYLATKKWQHWFLVVGPAADDELYAAAATRSAAKFGANIIAQKRWTFQTANTHADTGHVTLQTEIPAFTRVGDYDVLVVADEQRTFGEELADRTFLPRPVVGTQGLVATGWSPVNEEWGALQLQDRFMRKFHRHMTARDYAAWLAVRAVGEAAVRSRSSDGETVAKYMRGSEFLVSGFKGQGQSFRHWNGQMRQPILIAGPRILVSASPQPGFLHQRNVLDTLGFDEHESQCKL